ncbi:hypothetical protein R3P38DRAFT_1802343 [Favolaschia claudopus]|uniref:Secreted protein n=1 Tax=Favolaschia claudopus TaxID=2862362 RepID=A0AAW0A5U0_9AGAR
MVLCSICRPMRHRALLSWLRFNITLQLLNPPLLLRPCQSQVYQGTYFQECDYSTFESVGIPGVRLSFVLCKWRQVKPSSFSHRA